MPKRSLLSPRALPGLLIVALGVMLLAHNFGYLSLRSFQQVWPLLVVAFGLHLIFSGGHRVLGLALTISGVALQMDALGWIDLEWRAIWRFWPVALLVIGGGMLLRPGNRDNLVGGSVLVGLGAYFLASNLKLITFGLWELWPVAIIIAGVAMILKAVGR
jgi:hypothetical protein